VIFCKDASPLEQISWLSEEQFSELLKSDNRDNFLLENVEVNALCKEFGIQVQLNVYSLVKNFQASFDYSIIPFSEEYYDTLGIEK